VLGGYRFDTRPGPRPTVRARLVAVDDAPALERGIAYGQGATWARELTNTRTSVKTPAWMAAQVERELTPLGVQVVTRDTSWLAEQGFGGVLAVGCGSASPPCLVEASWRPRGVAAAPHLVIVGKGITFDTGGYNLKPGASMKGMYTDMAGGAAAVGALRIIAALRVPVRVTVLVPLAENSVSGSAMRPGDVIRHYGGRTTEVLNTDAEGRLVLADGLAYAAARLRPTALADIATLTGGIKVSLGERTGGLFTPSDDLATALLEAAALTEEPLWRMPLVDEYASQLESDIADANNSAGNPQATTAAMFLRPFAGSIPWAHLDIAGPARASSARGLVTEGATGFGARLLARWSRRRRLAELVLPFVVRIERDAPPTRTDALEAAARGGGCSCSPIRAPSGRTRCPSGTRSAFARSCGVLAAPSGGGQWRSTGSPSHTAVPRCGFSRRSRSTPGRAI